MVKTIFQKRFFFFLMKWFRFPATADKVGQHSNSTIFATPCHTTKISKNTFETPCQMMSKNATLIPIFISILRHPVTRHEKNAK
jgi:hypothetical protein